jgi:tetratricopeptide (TPR) repeat protein
MVSVRLRADLPPEAQALEAKGIVAAKEEEWLIAIQEFQDARKIAPDAPELYFNLGLAESKIPGRELRSICWFSAFLDAAPKSPNAIAVRDLIGGLEIKSLGNISRMIGTTRDVANQIPEEESGLLYKYMKDYYLIGISDLYVEMGDMTSATKVAELVRDRQLALGVALSGITLAQLARGEIASAQTTADLMPQDSYGKKDMLASIGAAQARVNDIEGARKTADLTQDAAKKIGIFEGIAESQLKAGDIDGEQKTVAEVESALGAIYDAGVKNSAEANIADAEAKAGAFEEARKSANLIQDVALKGFVLNSIVEIEVKTGDVLGALKTTELIPNDTSGLPSSHKKDTAFADIAVAQAGAGDIAGAQETVSLSQAQFASGDNDRAAEAIAEAQARAGDFVGAQETANSIGSSDSNEYKDKAKEAIIEIQAAQGTTSEWIRRLCDSDKFHDCALNTDPFLDLAGYLSTQHSDDPARVFASVKDTADKLIKAQNIIDKMLKQQGQIVSQTKRLRPEIVSPSESNQMLLDSIASKIHPSGVIFLEGKPLLKFGNSFVKIGSHFAVTYKGTDYDFELTQLGATDYTLKYKDVEFTQPIAN